MWQLRSWFKNKEGLGRRCPGGWRGRSLHAWSEVCPPGVQGPVFLPRPGLEAVAAPGGRWARRTRRGPRAEQRDPRAGPGLAGLGPLPTGRGAAPQAAAGPGLFPEATGPRRGGQDSRGLRPARPGTGAGRVCCLLTAVGAGRLRGYMGMLPVSLRDLLWRPGGVLASSSSEESRARARYVPALGESSKNTGKAPQDPREGEGTRRPGGVCQGTPFPPEGMNGALVLLPAPPALRGC